MSTISPKDQDLLERLKKRIEEEAGLTPLKELTQKDFDYLVYLIEEKSGTRISLSTIKRIWKDENNRLPHISTLDALAQVAFHKKWHSLKTDTATKFGSPKIRVAKQYRKWGLMGMALLILGTLFAFIYFGIKKSSLDAIPYTENVPFSARTSAENKVPNSVVFDYDISKVHAKKFYLQQSWDTLRRIEISKKHTQQTDIYYVPGLFFAKLIADTTILAQIPVHIKTADWFVRSQSGNKEQFYDSEHHLHNGALEVDLPKDFEEPPIELIFYNSREFATDGDNFTYTSSIKMDSIPGITCPKVSILIKGTNDYFMVQLIKDGCESDAFLKLGEKHISGKTKDLTALGTDVYDWSKFKVKVENRVVVLEVDGKEIYSDRYEKPIGVLKEITYIFNGWGAIDNIELKDLNKGITFADNFD